MIGQRLAVWGSTAVRPHANPAPARSRQLAPPAVPWNRPAQAAREHLLAFLHRSVLLQLMLAMALISFAALIYLNQASKESVIQFNIADLQRQQIELNLRNANLYASATSLQSLGRIESLASTKLHMTQPGQSDLNWIRPVFPRVAALPPDRAAVTAQRESQPIAWMQHAIQFIAAQL